MQKRHLYTKVKAGHCTSSPGSCWILHKHESGWVSAALRAPDGHLKRVVNGS